MKLVAPVVLFLVLVVAACNSQDSPAAPSEPTTTETFSGTLDAQGSSSHNFTVGVAGQVNITLTAAAPPATITVGLGVGTPTDTSCTVASSVAAQAGTSPQLAGVANAGTYCVVVYDIGNVGTTVDYTVTVAHP